MKDEIRAHLRGRDLDLAGFVSTERLDTVIRDFDFSRIHRALVHGAGMIAGCFNCLKACPIGRNER